MRQIADENSHLSSLQDLATIDRSRAIKDRDDALKEKVKFHFLNPWQKLKQRWQKQGRFHICDSIKDTIWEKGLILIRKSCQLKKFVKIVLHIILFVLLTTQVSRCMYRIELSIAMVATQL